MQMTAAQKRKHQSLIDEYQKDYDATFTDGMSMESVYNCHEAFVALRTYENHLSSQGYDVQYYLAKNPPNSEK